jgi:hypothetical protein
MYEQKTIALDVHDHFFSFRMLLVNFRLRVRRLCLLEVNLHRFHSIFSQQEKFPNRVSI